MASAFLFNLLSTTKQAIQRLAVPRSSSSDPRSSVLKDLKKLERRLTRIKALLHDAEEREIREEAVKLWLKELKEVAYDAEDVLDEYHYEELRASVEGRASRKGKRVEGDDEEEILDTKIMEIKERFDDEEGGASRRRKRGKGNDDEAEVSGGGASGERKREKRDDEEEVCGPVSTIEVSIPEGMGDRIREINERLDEIWEDRECLRLREEDGERRDPAAPYPAPSSHMVDESRIYGREDDKQKVMDRLLSEDMRNGMSVIPIVGKGGLGKTTIAQLVYNDSKVKEYFDLTGWVCVSDDFDVPRLTKAIIQSITGQSCDLTELSPLQNSLKERVDGRKVMLVLDDVWNEQQSLWELLSVPFVGEETAVRIIVTCRNQKVAETMRTEVSYRPGCLSPEQSWSLFRHYAFAGRESKEQSSLADTGKQIVQKCSGLPLAVKSIGSLLRHIADEDGWREVLQNDIWEVDENNEILPALKLSYNRMPAHLKPCFVFCSVFPKDYEFSKDYLVRQWMAQGYIPPGGSRTMEDIGHEYCNDLQGRSFFDSVDDKFDFKMHDMIHDLAKFIAGNECHAIVDNKLPAPPNEVRHLYMGPAWVSEKPQDWCNFTALRTLLLPHRYSDTTDKFSQPLRCLQLCKRWEVGTLDFLRNLKHLRYLEIQSRTIKRLPESVCLLYHLQALIIGCGLLEELPDGLGNLINLRYFELYSHAIERLPESVCQLRNLQSVFLNSCPQLEELPSGIGSLTNLRHLYSRYHNFHYLPESVCQLRNLQTLDLYCYRERAFASELGSCHYLVSARIVQLPAGIEKLTNLQTLRGQYKVQCGMGVLKNLVNLQKDLRISGLRNVVSMEDVGLKYQHELERLYLLWDAHCKNDWHYMSRSMELSLEFLPEENKDVPTDGRREEALLEHLQPPANLKKLVINGYAGSKFPEWVGNPLSFASIKVIEIIDCGKIRSLPLYIDDTLGKLDASVSKSMLKRVTISGCPKLMSIGGLHNLHSLKELKIYFCPELLILSEKGLPSKLRTLHIWGCQQLTSLPELQNLTSLQELAIISCPKLQILAEDQLSSMPVHVKIIGCPGLENWCQIQKIQLH